MLHVFKGKVIHHRYKVGENSELVYYRGGVHIEYVPCINYRSEIEWDEIKSTNDIEFPITGVGTRVVINGETLTIENVEINEDGSITCYTNRVLFAFLNEDEKLAVEAEVKRLYEERIEKAERREEERKEKEREKELEFAEQQANEWTSNKERNASSWFKTLWNKIMK